MAVISCFIDHEYRTDILYLKIDIKKKTKRLVLVITCKRHDIF